jgi:hypothetical protein
MGRTYYHILDIHISFEFPHDFRRTKRPTSKPWNTTTEITTILPGHKYYYCITNTLYYCNLQLKNKTN